MSRQRAWWPGRWAAAAFVLGSALAIARVAPAQVQDPTPKNYALLVGIDSYQAEGVKNLRFAARDAEAFKKVLEAKGYIAIPLVEHLARREKIIGELTWLARTAQPNDTVLIYFAGHGVRARHGAREYTYWLTRDTTLSRLEIDGLRLNHVLDYIADIPARRKLIILDHCHSGKVGDAMLATDLSRDATTVPQLDRRNLFAVDEFEGLVEEQSTEGTVLFGAAWGDAYEFDELKHGIFTYVLLQAFQSSKADAAGNRNGRLSVSELRSFVGPEVKAIAEAKGVRQAAVNAMRGMNLDWELGVVGSDEDELRGFLGKLEAQGEFNFNASIRYYTALGNVERARSEGIEPTADDRRLIDRLRQEMTLALSFSLSERAKRLESFLAGL